MSEYRKKILFVGAGGILASKIFPSLAKKYDIVGIGGKRGDLKEYCVDFYSGNLLTEYGRLFEKALDRHTFDVVIWNPVQYYFTPLIQTSRESLHIEFDIAIALPLELLRSILPKSAPASVFALISSMSAFHHSANLGSYGIVKNAQLKLVEGLSVELAGRMFFKAIAPSSVPKIPTETLVDVFISAIENTEPAKILYKVATL